MNILALDLSTKTGWATKYQSGVQEFPLKRGDSPGMRFLNLRGWLNQMLSILGKIDVIVYEQAHHRGGAATQLCVGMVTHVLSFCAENNIDVTGVHTGTLKKHATGKGNASKEQMMSAGRAKGWSFLDDNECDALWLLDYATKKWGLL